MKSNKNPPFFPLRRAFPAACVVLLLALILISAGCFKGEDTNNSDDSADVADDSTDDDSADDADDDSADDADDSSDDSTDDTADDTSDDDADRMLYVPAEVDETTGPVAVLQTRYNESGVNYAKVSLIASPGGSIVREGPAFALGSNGAANLCVEDFTGDGIAEIAASLVTLDAEGNSDSRIVLLDPQTLDVDEEIAHYPAAQAYIGTNIDMSRDGLPELTVRVRPDETGGGSLHAFDGRYNWIDRLNYTAPDGMNAELYALPERSGWMKPSDFSGQDGSEILVAAYDRTGSTPTMSLYAVKSLGEVAESLGPFDLAAAGAFSVSTRDADGDGDAEILFSVEQTAATNLYVLDDLATPLLNLAAAPGTSADVTLATDLDGDGLRDFIFSITDPDGFRFIEGRFSATAYTEAVDYGPDGDRATLIAAPIAPGLSGRAEIASGVSVFGVVFETWDEGGPSHIDFYTDPLDDAVKTLSDLAGSETLMKVDAQLRDLTGDAYAEVATVASELLPDDFTFQHRVAVFGGENLDPLYDTGFIAGSAVRSGSWDFDQDGVAELQILHYGTADNDAPWIELLCGASDWDTPVLTLTGDADSDILLYGLVR